MSSAATVEAASCPRAFKIEHDDEQGLVRVTGSGIWTVSIMDKHFDELDLVLRAIRATGKPVRVFVDLTQAPEQSDEVLARIGVGKARIYKSEDRVALLVSSSRGKIQMRNAHNAPNHGLFLSMNAARTWLFAWDECRDRKSDDPARLTT